MSLVFLLVLFVLSLLYIALKCRETLSRLSGLTLVGILLLLAVYVGGAVVFLYYLGEWTTGIFENIFVLVFTQVLSFLILISACLSTFYKLLSKLSEN